MMASIRDILHISYFQLLRAFRTRTILFLTSVYLLISTGMAWIARNIIHELENSTADLLLVPKTKTPGAMMETLRTQDDFHRIIENLIPEPEMFEWAMTTPILTIFHYWMSLLLLPFIVAIIGAESISPNIENRSIRYEILRTGRLELILGRLLGYSILITFGTFLAVLGPLAVGSLFMVQQPFWQSFAVLLGFVPKLILWSLPFLGIGISSSMLWGYTNLSRILALSSVVVSWILFGITNYGFLYFEYPLLCDILTPLIPQSHIIDLWNVGWDWVPSGMILLFLGFGFSLLTYPIFVRKNL